MFSKLRICGIGGKDYQKLVGADFVKKYFGFYKAFFKGQCHELDIFLKA
jgi:hypothetical protein